MASNYSYFLSAGFLDELDEEEFDDDFNLAVEEVAASTGVFSCPNANCKKTYKTKGGLQRHINKKHTEREVKKLVLDNVVLIDLLRKAVEVVSKDECWSLTTRSCITNFSYIVDGKLVDKVYNICETFLDSDDPEKFFELFFCEITAKANEFFPDLPLAPATTVMMQLGETVFSYLKFGNTSSSENVAAPISKCEIDALQYLSGYVVHKFLKKTKNNLKYNSQENQAVIVILESMVDKTRELTLVDSQTRGGLTSISEDCEQLFYRTEEAFRKETSVPNLRSIDIAKITVDLISQADIISIINSISDISGSNIDPEVKKNLFEKMIQLYLRVRSFSFTRDITSQKRKASTATKGLRKEMKKKQS